MRIRSSEGSAQAYDFAGLSAITQRRMIGELLDLSADKVQRIADHQAVSGQLFGEAAIELGLATPDDVRRAIEQQLSFKVLSAEDASIDPLIVAAFDPDDPLSLSVRTLRASLSAATLASGQPIGSLVILGAEMGSETSLIAANLAVAYSQASYRTLLIDANLDLPTQHGLFRLANRSGLSSLLSSSDRAAAVIQQCALPGLSIVTAGPSVPNALELFERSSLAQRLQELSDGFDIMLIDAGRADAGALGVSTGIDAAILVVGRHVSRLGTIQSISDRLGERGTQLLGSVLID